MSFVGVEDHEGARPSPFTASVVWLALAVAVCVVVWALASRREGPAPVAADVPSPHLLLFDDEQLDDVAARGEPESRRSGPADDERFSGFCPSGGQAPVERPSLAALVNERTAELIDRARALRRGERSDELQRGFLALYGHGGEREAAVPLFRRAPDRRDGDFDHAAAAALTLGARALQRQRWDEARLWAREAAIDAPDDGAPWALLALVEQRDGHRDAAVEALRQAFDRAPEEPAIGLALGRALADTADTAGAIAALDTYLEEFSQDAIVAGLRARLQIRLDLYADAPTLFREGVTVVSAPTIEPAIVRNTHDAVLDALRRAAELLGTARRPTLTVWIHDARADMLAVTCVQGWARAVFDGSLHLDGSSLSGERSVTSHIEHETLHAQLADVAPSAPVWLHEGLAQHFAGQCSRRCLETWAFMVRNETWIPFASLGGSFQVISDSADAGMAYHQSLGMVEMIMARGGRRAIHEAVTYLHGRGDPEALLDHLGGDRPFTGRELLETLAAALLEEGIDPPS